MTNFCLLVHRFLQFQLTVNLTAVFVAFVGACFVQDNPFRTLQLLWINLVQDTLASLALATDPPTDELLDRAPYPRSHPVITRLVLKNIILHAIYQIIIVFTIIFVGTQYGFNIIADVLQLK